MDESIDNTISTIIENYTSIKGDITRQLNRYQEEINNLVSFQEVINKLTSDNNDLKVGMELKDKEISKLKEQIGDKINFNNVSMLKRQDREIYELKNKVSYLEKQVSFYKLQQDNSSNRTNSPEITLTKSQIEDKNEFIMKVLTTNNFEDSNIRNDDKQSVISISDDVNKYEDEKEEIIIKKKPKKQKVDKKGKVEKKEKVEKKQKVDKKKLNNNKLTKDEEEELEMFEEDDKDYYIHNSTNRVFEILENDEVGKLIGIIEKDKLVKIN